MADIFDQMSSHMAEATIDLAKAIRGCAGVEVIVGYPSNVIGKTFTTVNIKQYALAKQFGRPLHPDGRKCPIEKPIYLACRGFDTLPTGVMIILFTLFSESDLDPLWVTDSLRCFVIDD